MNKKYFGILMMFCLIVLVGAIQISNFDGFGIAENLTFTGNENITRNITIYKNANVTSSFLNLSGYINNNYVFNFLIQENPDFYSYESINLNPSTPITNAFDNDEGTEASNNDTFGTTEIVLNYTKPTDYLTDRSGLIWEVKARQGPFTRFNNITIPDSCYNAYVDNVLLKYYMTTSSGGGPTNQKIYWGCWNGAAFSKTFYVGTTLADTDGPALIEEKVFWYNYGNYTSNINITIGGETIWNHTEDFNSTFSPNKSDDFSVILNTALNSGACDCTGCTLSGDNCTINFTFHSDTAGILEYSAIDINWSEYINPNVTINAPIGEDADTQIDYNLSTADNLATDTCILWVMRGASLEIANTTVTCGSEITGTVYVSSIGTEYIFYFWVNDTSGNSNETNSTFSVASGGAVILNPTSGGGGNTIIIDETTDWDLTTDAGTDSYAVVLIKGATRKKLLFFVNNGENIEKLSLTCEDVRGKMCTYVEFEEDEITLATGKDIIKTASFSIKPSTELTGQEYTFNIIATDEQGGDDLITVKATFSNNPILKTGIKLVSLKTISDNFEFPYVLIFGFVYIVLQLASFKILNDKIPASKFVTFLGSMIVALIVVYFI